jgi:protein ImuB
VVPPGTAATFLAPAPLAALAAFVPDPDVLDTWERLGLTTIGEVGALPTGAVVARFGPAGQWVHLLARGLDPQLLRPEPVPPDVTVAADLDPPAERAEAVAFLARTLAEELVDRLGGWGLACTQVVVTAHTEHGEAHERCWRLDGPARASGAPRSLAAAIADRARWQVDGWLSGPAATRPTAGVSRLVLAPGSVEPARGRQLGFWGGEAGAGERVVRAVARLEGLVGPDAVRVAEARGGRRSGDEVGLVPTAAVDVSVARQVALTFGTAPWPGRLPAPSPSVVHRPARPAEVLDAEGRSVEVTGRGEVRRPPHTVRVEADPPHDVVAWAGPWPVDQRWWDTEAHERRARLQVVTDQGVALLLGRADGSWWVDAVYA